MSGRILRAFSPAEARTVEGRLVTLCGLLRHVPGGDKIEEGYWAAIYRDIKGIPGKATWSNKPFRDFLYGGLGVEWKLLKRNSPSGEQGNSLMHPAATRTIDYDPTSPAEVCMKVVLDQWCAAIRDFRDRVRETSAKKNAADIRWGVLLWSPNLDEFLYFEEEIIEPDPTAFSAQWVADTHRGRPTRNLHIFEKSTGKKRYSITLPLKGAKIQPYFDVPTVKAGAHLFRVPVAKTQPVLVPLAAYDELTRAAARAGKDPGTFVAELLVRHRARSPKG